MVFCFLWVIGDKLGNGGGGSLWVGFGFRGVGCYLCGLIGWKFEGYISLSIWGFMNVMNLLSKSWNKEILSFIGSLIHWYARLIKNPSCPKIGIFHLFTWDLKPKFVTLKFRLKISCEKLKFPLLWNQTKEIINSFIKFWLLPNIASKYFTQTQLFNQECFLYEIQLFQKIFSNFQMLCP